MKPLKMSRSLRILETTMVVYCMVLISNIILDWLVACPEEQYNLKVLK